MASWNVFFCPAESPKPKDCSFTVMSDKERKQILAFMKLEPILFEKQLINWSTNHCGSRGNQSTVVLTICYVIYQDKVLISLFLSDVRSGCFSHPHKTINQLNKSRISGLIVNGNVTCHSTLFYQIINVKSFVLDSKITNNLCQIGFWEMWWPLCQISDIL